MLCGFIDLDYEMDEDNDKLFREYVIEKSEHYESDESVAASTIEGNKNDDEINSERRQECLNEELNVDFSIKQAYRTGQKIMQNIEGTYPE